MCTDIASTCVSLRLLIMLTIPHFQELCGGDFLIPAHADSVTVTTQIDCVHCHSILPVHLFKDLLLREHGFDAHLAIAHLLQKSGKRFPCSCALFVAVLFNAMSPAFILSS